jgi:hypothetical protein
MHSLVVSHDLVESMSNMYFIPSRRLEHDDRLLALH